MVSLGTFQPQSSNLSILFVSQNTFFLSGDLACVRDSASVRLTASFQVSLCVTMGRGWRRVEKLKGKIQSHSMMANTPGLSFLYMAPSNQSGGS